MPKKKSVSEYDCNRDEIFSPCESCGKPLSEHLGLTPTCAKLQKAIAEFESLREVLRDWLCDDNDSIILSLKNKVESALKKLK